MIRLSPRHARRALVVAAAAALLALPATPARADSPISTADLDCTITVDVNPGVTPQLRRRCRCSRRCRSARAR
jgi:hypothetical protein